jgi:hypothetical protein
VDEHGQIRLIDNEAALQSTWKNCGFDSILVPTTQKHNIVRLSNQVGAFGNQLPVTGYKAKCKAKAKMSYAYLVGSCVIHFCWYINLRNFTILGSYLNG